MTTNKDRQMGPIKRLILPPTLSLVLTLAVWVFLPINPTLAGDPGDLDPTFGNGGGS